MVTSDKLKCMACGLHYIVYSDIHNDRDPKLYHCPECGTQGSALLLRREQHEGAWVFQFVPGPSKAQETVAEARAGVMLPGLPD